MSTVKERCNQVVVQQKAVKCPNKSLKASIIVKREISVTFTTAAVILVEKTTKLIRLVRKPRNNRPTKTSVKISPCLRQAAFFRMGNRP